MKTNLMLALVVLYVGMAHSWEIAVSLGNRLEFYTNGTKTHTVHFKSQNLTAIIYDDVHNMMLFVDKQSDNDAICGYNLGSTNIRCFIKRTGSNIQDIAFDPATELLFFTDAKEGSINSISLRNQESEDNVYGNLVIKIDDPLSRDVKNIALDSCRGYVYWTYTYNFKGDNMERARFNSSEREVVYKLLPVLSFAIDPQTHTNYYIDGAEWLQAAYFYKADLRKQILEVYQFNNQKTIYECDHSDNNLYFTAPNELTVSNYYFYWINSSFTHTTIWRRPKNASRSEEPKSVIQFFNEKPLSIATNYRIREQVKGLEDCEALSSLVSTITATDNSNKKNGERCIVSACENYCLKGNCSFDDEGLRKCRCNAGYSGERCEINACHGYCLNDGDCSFNEKNEPICKCEGSYAGNRCEVNGCLNYCFKGSCIFNDEAHPVCRCNAGYSGERCEVSVCHGYCYYNGECMLNEEGEPICECVGKHEGTRCEVVKNGTLTNATLSQYYSANLTLASLLSNWRKLTANVSVIIEV